MNNIFDKQTARHLKWGDNCDSWIMVDTEGLIVKQESMPAGTSEKLHFHAHSQQFFFILRGTATFYVDGKKKLVNEHQGILILPESKHYIANESTRRISFIVVSQPTINNDRTVCDV